MERRQFVGVVSLGVTTMPLASTAGWAGSVPVVGILNQSSGPRSGSVDSLRRYLRELGYVEGQTVVLDVRFAGGKPEAFPALAAELARRKVDVLVAIGPAALKAARAATTVIPILAVDLETDPVEGGYARSIAHPGGNVTGQFLDLPGLTGKWLELIKETAPTVRRVAILWIARPALGSSPRPERPPRRSASNSRFWRFKAPRSRAGAGSQLEGRGASHCRVVVPSPQSHGLGGADCRLRGQAPPAYDLHVPELRRGRRSPGYGPDQPEYLRRLAAYVDKVLKGAVPADLPIEQPTKFELGHQPQDRRSPRPDHAAVAAGAGG